MLKIRTKSQVPSGGVEPPSRPFQRHALPLSYEGNRKSHLKQPQSECGWSGGYLKYLRCIVVIVYHCCLFLSGSKRRAITQHSIGTHMKAAVVKPSLRLKENGTMPSPPRMLKSTLAIVYTSSAWRKFFHIILSL